MNLFIVMCVCDGLYAQEFNCPTTPGTSQPPAARLPGGWETPDVCSGNQIQILSKNSKFLTADPPLQHQQIFVEQYFQTKG